MLSVFHQEALDKLGFDMWEAVSSPENFADWYETTMNGFDKYSESAGKIDFLLEDLKQRKAAHAKKNSTGSGWRLSRYWPQFIKPHLADGIDLRVILAVLESRGTYLDWATLMNQMFAFSPLGELFTNQPDDLWDFHDWVHEGVYDTPSGVIRKLRTYGMDWEMNTTTAKKLVRKFGGKL